jgi:DDE superfamily endonuclease
LIKETRVRIPATPGRPARTERNGTANIFMLFTPLDRWRHVEVTDRHAAVDYAHLLRDGADRWFPNAGKTALVQDNLSTHKPASLYEAFPPAEVRRLVERFEWHYTPKHGSWFNMAETELSVLSSQFLDRRISSKQVLNDEVSSWEAARNKHHAKADWQFTTGDARVKLKRLYPSIRLTRAAGRLALLRRYRTLDVDQSTGQITSLPVGPNER